ncbi:hypothetical protein PVAND_003905 [Polypedilum vanderplanki]|uniref:F-box domain-containing protein n=1 Tax=Polypedilum vanderplanki TaxID=319348 RepID=A0A9J6BW20_POLVA|nr:hypothetical protein PVAND_003905 [Polypedilum vanderplanki]
MEFYNKIDVYILNLLPNELWAIVLSYLPRISRQSLSKLHGFKELIDNVTHLEEKKLYNALRTGQKLIWQKTRLTGVQMQSRLKHGAVTFNNEMFIFGGASTNQTTSGNYNDLWIYNNYDKFKRMVFCSSIFPSPKSNFGMTNEGRKIFIVGGKGSVGNAIEQPYSNLFNAFEIHSLDVKNGIWHKTMTTGNENEPRVSNGIRCIMLSNLELIAVAGLVPTFHNWDAMNAEENVHYRASLQVSLLKFTDETLEKGQWYNLADIQQTHRRGFPMPRTESHLVKLGNDCIFMFGGRAINSSCQDGWIMKITRNPYSLKWYQVNVDNLLVPPLPTHIFPSCVVQDILVFTGVRTSVMKKPENEKPRNSNNESQRSPAQQQQQPSPSSSSSSNSPSIRQQPAEMRRIFINSERPLSTIGAMVAFTVPVPAPVVPQKVLKIQVSNEPSPSPPPQLAKAVRTRDYPMRVYCLDLKNIMNCTDEMLREKLSVRWLTLKNNGLYNGAPELRAYSTFNRLDNGITMIGGVKRNQAAEEDDSLFTQATNEVFILTYSNDNET